MADTKGFVICDHAHCNEIAEVRQASGNRSNLYTVCPACKTDQSNGVERQRWLLANMVSKDQIDTLKAEAVSAEPEPDYEAEQEAERQAAKPRNNAASSDLSEAEEVANKPTNKPKITAKVPLIAGLLLAVIALIFAIIKQFKGQQNDTANA